MPRTSRLDAHGVKTQMHMVCKAPDQPVHGVQVKRSTAGPLIIESSLAEKRVSTGALGARDDPLVVQTKI